MKKHRFISFVLLLVFSISTVFLSACNNGLLAPRIEEEQDPEERDNQTTEDPNDGGGLSLHFENAANEVFGSRWA